MAIDEADQSDAEQFSDAEVSDDESAGGGSDETVRNSSVRVGAYTWADFMEEYGYERAIPVLYPHGRSQPEDNLGLSDGTSNVPHGEDWNAVDFDPEQYLGYHPDELPDLITETFAANAKALQQLFLDYVDPETTPVVKDIYTLEHYKWEYYYDSDGSRPRKRGEIVPFDGEDALGFEPEEITDKLHQAGSVAMALDEIVDERTVNVREDFEEDEFFSTDAGYTTVTNRYDLERAVPFEKKRHFREVERYWVNKPYAFVIIFHSEKENEKKYYVIEPYLNEIEDELQEFLSGKLRTAIKYSDKGIKERANEEGRRQVIEDETRRLLKRYDLFEKGSGKKEIGLLDALRTMLEEEDDEEEEEEYPPQFGPLEGIQVRPESILLEEDSDTLSEYQVEKLLYLLKRNFIGYERIDAIKHDINVEDVSCDGYNSPVFVYHSGYEQVISNIFHGEEELDHFVVKLAQRSGKGISKRLPQVDAKLPDGSRAQLTLGREVSDHGTNYTIRQFKDVPFTPIDLINWNTFSLDEMAFLWLSIENHKSLLFAGGTASGKTTSLNAVSLFIPSNSKIVSIEDTREVELPQRNWIASITRPSFVDDSTGDVDEFDLLEAALRQRPDYIVMGEIRGEEGRTLFQVMSTGHTTYTTFHADSVDEVLKRFTTDPINVSKTMFTALDLVSIQTQTRYQGKKVRRNKSLTEINHYEAEHDEINVQDVYQWQAETDEYLKMGDSNTLDEIKFDRGWNDEKLQNELFRRKVILAYLIRNELNTYAEVAATVQAFINDPETILTLIANNQLEDSLEDLRKMESVLIDVDPQKEELVPRPDPTTETYNLAMDILERAEESLFEEYRGKVPSGLASALSDVKPADPVDVGPDDDAFDFDGDVSDEWNLGEASNEFSFGMEAESEPESSGVTATAESSSPTFEQRAPELEAGEEEPATGPLDASEHSPQLADRRAPELEDIGDFEDIDDFEGVEELAADPEGHLRESETESEDPAADDDFDELFEEWGRTLEQYDDPSLTQEMIFDESTVTDEEAQESEAASDIDDGVDAEAMAVDTSDFDAMFPDRDLESIFGGDQSIGASESESVLDTSDDRSDSIFGDQSSSIFTDDGDDADASLFDDTEESPFGDDDSGASDGSIFEREDDDGARLFESDDDESEAEESEDEEEST